MGNQEQEKAKIKYKFEQPFRRKTDFNLEAMQHHVYMCMCACVFIYKFKKRFIYKFKNMSSATYKILFPISIVVLSMCCIKASRELQENEEIPALMAFGDSILDTGNNNDLISVLKCNFPPYGMDFIGGKPTGRFCDGKVLTDLIGM